MAQGKRERGEIMITVPEPLLGRLEILAKVNGRTPAQEVEAVIESHLESAAQRQAAELMTDEELDERLARFDERSREHETDDA